MVQCCTRVSGIRHNRVQTEAAFPVFLGELACTSDGGWIGQVCKSSGTKVDLLPLDPPEKLKYGDSLFFTDQKKLTGVQQPQFGTVIDPLGRPLLRFSENTKENSFRQTAHRNLWGLGNIGEFMQLREGTAVALVGKTSAVFSALLPGIVANQGADSLLIFFQGDLRKLQSLCRTLSCSQVGAHTVVVWTAPWSPFALTPMVPECLASQSSTILSGKQLVLIDDLSFWLDRMQAFGEENDELPVPDGYPYLTRQLFEKMFTLMVPPKADGRSVSLLAGWHLDTEYPYLFEHPLGCQLPRFAETGFILDEQADSLLPTLDSWGTPTNITRACKIFRDVRIKRHEEVELEVLSQIEGLFRKLYVEFLPYRATIIAVNSSFESENLEKLSILLSRPLEPVSQSLGQLRKELQLKNDDGLDLQRKSFIEWLSTRSGGEKIS